MNGVYLVLLSTEWTYNLVLYFCGNVLQWQKLKNDEKKNIIKYKKNFSIAVMW